MLLPEFPTGNPRIVARVPDRLSDTVLTMPAIQRLRESQPRAHLAILCAAKVAPLWNHNPFVDEVIAFDQAVDVADLADRDFEIAVIFHPATDAIRECRRAGIRQRIGYRTGWHPLLLTQSLPASLGSAATQKQVDVAGRQFHIQQFSTLSHAAQKHLDLVACIGASAAIVSPKLYVAHEEFPPLTKFFKDDGRPCFGIHAGADGGPAKQWPPYRFAAVAKAVVEQTDGRWLLLGGPADIAVTMAIENEINAAGVAPQSVLNLAGRTTLPELFFLLKLTSVLLSNDTAVMHIAAALEVPVVGLFGPTAPEQTGPLGAAVTVLRQPVECSPCFLEQCPIDFRCMDRLTVPTVTAAVLHYLGNETR